MAKRQTRKPRFKLVLVIEQENSDEHSLPYDLDNANPWPLGTYNTEAEAIAARNSMVIVKEGDRSE